MGEYAERFEHIAQHFQAAGFAVHLVDLRGFGYSGGARGCSKVEEMEMDLASLV
jgi:acylglycerol lipase